MQRILGFSFVSRLLLAIVCGSATAGSIAHADNRTATAGSPATLPGAGADISNPSEAAVRTELAAQYAKLAAAFRNKDAHAYSAMMTADAAIQLPNGSAVRGAQIESSLKEQLAHIQSVERAAYTIDKLDIEGKTVTATATCRSGILILDADGKPHRVDQINTVRNTWKRTAQGWRIQRAEPVRVMLSVDGKLTQDIYLSLPSAVETQSMVKQSLLAWNRAVQNGDYTSFHAGLAKPFRDQFTPDKLRDTFQVFADKKIDIGSIDGIDATFDKAPAIDERGVLKVSGSYATKPARVIFDLEFLREEDAWRLAGLDVHVR